MRFVTDTATIENMDIDRGTVVTLGAFDGLHIGHMALVKETERLAVELDVVSVMLTFPLNGKCLISRDEKLSFLRENSALEYVLEQPFVHEFSDMSPAEFAEKYLKEQLNCKCVVIGFNNRFGRNASGDVETMQELGARFGFRVVVVPPVCLGNDSELDEAIVVSSTKIKECLREGDIENVTKMLGRHYMIKGEVKAGKKLGRTIGFPTANIYPEESVFLPKNGVYAAKVRLPDGREKNAMINVGVNPTVKEQEKRLTAETGRVLPQYKVEANLFDFDEDIYGQEIEIIFEKFMREEQCFADVAELTSVLVSDRKQVAEYFCGRE